MFCRLPQNVSGHSFAYKLKLQCRNLNSLVKRIPLHSLTISKSIENSLATVSSFKPITVSLQSVSIIKSVRCMV